jgi:hypothetical protein
MIMEIQGAIDYQSGNRTTQTYARFNNSAQGNFVAGVNGTLTGP